MRNKFIVAALALILSAGAVAAPAMANPPAQSASVQTAEGTGVVKGIDLKAGAVTIKHEPIPALKWPAMTMTFKVKSAALLTGIAVGKKVNFELTSDNGKPIITSIGPRS